MSATSKFTIFIRDDEFTLRKSQLEFDSPNYFTSYFFGDFSESGRTTLVLDRSPELFAIIVEYMSGYRILPLARKALPRTMDESTALANLVEDAAFYGLSKLHALLITPAQPNIDFSWTGFAGRVVLFEDVLQGKLPETVSYTTSGLCSIEGGSVKPVIISARDMALKLVGNLDLDRNGYPEHHSSTASYRLDLSREIKSLLERQPYSAFEYHDKDPNSLIVSVFPESRLYIDGTRVRFEQFPVWWRARRAPFAPLKEAEESAIQIFEAAFPSPFEPTKRDEVDKNEFSLWADELLFVIAARGFIAGTLQLHVKLLDVRARTRAEILSSLRPPYLLTSN